MRYFPFLLLAIFLQACTPGSSSEESQAEQLFGTDSSQWFIGGDAGWSFVNGVLTGKLDSGSGFIMTRKAYGDFRLSLEFYPDSTINSGIFIRCLAPDISATECYEINIWDLHPNQEFRTGAVVTRSQPLNHVNTIGQWNKYVIESRGDSTRAWINEVQVVGLQDEQLPKGFVALQAAGSGRIDFRNVEIKVPK